jgi:hypothetical protein
MSMQTAKMTGMIVAMMIGTTMHAETFPPPASAAVAARSRVMNAGYLADASGRYAALPPASRKVLLDHLDAIASLPATADGIGSALLLLVRQVDAFPSGEQPQEGSGRSAGQLAMQSAGMYVIHGRVAQVADEAKQSPQEAATLIRVIRGAQTLSDRDRGLLLRELEQAFGRELYAKATRETSSRKGAKP